MEEKELIKRAQAGGKEAFEELFLQNKDKIFGTAYRLLGNVPDAEDAVSDTFLNAYRYLKSFKGESAFSTWLYRICFNVAYKHRRAKKLYLPEDNNEDSDSRPVQWVDKTSGADDFAADAYRKKKVRKCVAALSEKYRRVILMREFSNLSYEEISKELRCSAGTVMSRLHRARLSLKKLLEKEGLTD